MPMKVRELIRLLEQDGWYHVRTTGSHRHYNHPIKTRNCNGARQSGQGFTRRNEEQRTQAGRTEVKEALKYAVVFERSADGYGAFVPDLPGCITVGDILIEAEQNIREAIEGHIAVMEAHGEMIPKPTTLASYIEIPIAVGQ